MLARWRYSPTSSRSRRYLRLRTISTRVIIKPLGDNPGVQTKGRNYQIIARLQQDNAALFGPRPLYDGGSLLYSLQHLQGTNTIDVCMRRRSNQPTHQVSFRRVATIDLRLLRSLLARRNPNERPDPNAMPLNLLQLMVCQAPNLRYGFLAHARRFAVQRGAQDIGAGLSMWRAFFQSVRPALGRMLINVDRSSVPVYTPGPLIDVMVPFLGLRDQRELANLPRDKFAKLRVFLKGVLVRVRHRPEARAKPIADLVPQAGLEEFDKDGERWTVQRHFQSRWNRTVQHPEYVGVRIGQTSIVPAEFCIVEPAQVYKRRLPADVQRKFIELAAQDPRRRRRDIEEAISGGLFNYTNSDYIQDAGMTVNQNLLSVTGQVIPPPGIVYRNRTEPMTGRPGAWNLLNNRFFSVSAPLNSWAVVVFESEHRANRNRVNTFVHELGGNLTRLGLVVQNRAPHVEYGNPHNPAQTLENVGRALVGQYGGNRPQLILVVLPANAAAIKQAVKLWGDTVRMTPTQCVRCGKWDAVSGNKADQYRNNLALKINARLGGVNSIIRSPVSPILERSMVVGADVGHPGPGVSSIPSMTGLVASVSPDVSEFTSFAQVQRPRVEIIQDLEQMIYLSLGDYAGYREAGGLQGRFPEHLIFFRDGVSEGEFATVAREEIAMIRRAFVRHGMTDPRSQPKLLFVVVGKRHHVRFFPKRPEDADNSKNCPAGFLVHDQITNPNLHDFYLQSHAGILGTSRPGHYIVLSNEADFSKNEIYQMAYHLCHIYASATRSVSIPAPVYYADKICQRLSSHCSLMSASDTSSVNSGDTPFDLDEWKNNFKQSGLNKRKYFL
ncbi:Piwi-domain-containing protein [Lentinus tigrinus ALCF2SS1-7]|uniref:Piwi-domain-containing protein n=1 Tax=Lentinus tigrinus ALCF2SS1-7 TaxID=1328758 RepID=UPI001165F9E8|nr:Piwi-domain-containing protein [Lentinus tigrinus ALCF2SS1-7]